MRIRAFVLSAVLLGAVPLAGQAATRQVSLTSEVFTPEVRTGIEAGDTVLFRWLDGFHNVVSLQNGDFESGIRGAGEEFEVAYDGGIVRYRCSIHSRLFDGFRCTGMCGVLTDRPLESTPPSSSVDRPDMYQLHVPQLPSVNAEVTLSGTAADDTELWGVMVRVYDTTGKATEYMGACTGCGTMEATWTLTRNFAPGSYVAESIAVDASGNVAATFPRVHFFVL